MNGISTNGNVLVESPPSASSHSRFAGTNTAVRVEITRPTYATLMRLLLLQPDRTLGQRPLLSPGNRQEARSMFAR
ncbi:MAG: hypothetical protein FJ388_06255 [Verrucomicrobia bacterium]|nr:hypothetical protein [Verrucomicrobiota bacterium]